MKLKHLELTNKYSIFIDTHGYGFAGGFCLLPAITLHYHKGYFQITLSLFNKSKSLTVMKMH